MVFIATLTSKMRPVLPFHAPNSLPFGDITVYQRFFLPVNLEQRMKVKFMSSIFFFNKFIYLFTLFLAALGLCCCAQAFSSCGEQGLLFVEVCGLLIEVASLVAEYRLQARGLQQLQHTGSVVVTRRLQSTGSLVVAHGLNCSAACGIFPDQGSNPCPLHWQADS